MDVRIDSIPARRLAEITIAQLTSDMTFAVAPITAIAVCAIVRTALMSDALMKSFIIYPFR
jgi:hypothetical protein